MHDPIFPRKIAILGSTGSIGCQTLDVVRAHPDCFEVIGLAARSNSALFSQQVAEFHPKVSFATEIASEDSLIELASHSDVDVLVVATSGMVGLKPTLAAIRSGKIVAIANKETLVMAGHIVMEEIRKHKAILLPIDSEHSAIWQCVWGEKWADISKIILTASGGPFRHFSLEQMKSVTVEQTLAHPTWKMGPKVTVDSATLMNKGLEAIEARWLFDVPLEQIEVLVHPQSIVHSIVEFIDGSCKFQASKPSMCLPIEIALGYPERLPVNSAVFDCRLDWQHLSKLEFEPLDASGFPAFSLAVSAGRAGGTYPSVLLGADEEAVKLFLEKKIRFTQIAELVSSTIDAHTPIQNPSLDDIIEVANWAQQFVRESLIKVHS